MASITFRILKLFLWLGLFLGAQAAQADEGFRDWIKDFRTAALGQGISGATYERAFRGISAPDLEVIEKANFQPEFKAETWEYFDNRIHDRSVETGQAMAKQWAEWLNKIEKQYGVDRHILLAIWSLESNYGEVLDNEKVMRNVIRSLATLAYADPKRRKFARSQLLAALKILQSGDIDESHLTGSWAGAMGHTQFIPTSYQAYAVDVDGDGRRDIWNSVPDALASSANLLKRNGWRSGEAWGREVNPDEGGALMRPDGRKGPAFKLNRNFHVLKRYNNADRYALAVGLLADRIAGGEGLKRDWDRPFTPLKFAEKEELQRLLKIKGFYDGEIDGRIGPQSREAIRAFQKSAGMEENGYPSQEVLKQLKSGHQGSSHSLEPVILSEAKNLASKRIDARFFVATLLRMTNWDTPRHA